MALSILILGSGAATPSVNRNPSGILLKSESSSFLIDCGEGTQLQIRKYKESIQRIDQVFITHLHADHYLGLFGLISTQGLLGRERDLEIFAPKGLKEMIDVQLKITNTYLCFKLIIHEVDCSQSLMIFENKDIQVFSYPLNHKIPCSAYVFKEKIKPRNLIPSKITELKIPVYMRNKIKMGEDFIDDSGKIYANRTLTLDPQKPQSFAYFSDTKVLTKAPDVIQGVDLLYHESTFLHDMQSRAEKTYHSTALQAAEFAVKCEVKKLVLGHFSARYNELTDFVLEASKVFANVEVAKDGKQFFISE